MSHPSDYLDNENVNINGFLFEDNEFSILSINDDSYQMFLSYKLESGPDKSKKGRIIDVLGYTMFNICVDLPTINNRLRKTAIALKYYPEKGEMEIVTIT